MAKNITSKGKKVDDFNLRPDPRVLPMLGEINLKQWRCIAELIDNSIDGFLNAKREGNEISKAKVDVLLPQADNASAELCVIDNGPGMDPEQLEKAVRAGWSGNNPINNLGLFGMGFNIATARLGYVTEVWTTREGEDEWHGLVIDFEQLRKQRHFRTSHLTREKTYPEQHGTEIRVKQLKPEQRTWLTKPYNQTNVRKNLAQSYSSMLRPSGTPISFDLQVNERKIEPHYHCIWGEKRQVSVSGKYVGSFIRIDTSLGDRHYCLECMAWADNAEEDGVCPHCETADSVVTRGRRVHGWLGIQRYVHETEFGLDFIRNGRKIEFSNKDLFSWTDLNPEGIETTETEYPIDDQRNRGRIVGEIHIDHCRVSYAKDQFDRTDPSWDDMVQVVRGNAPLRPNIAKKRHYEVNESPLGLLYSAFRRSTPHKKTAGSYARYLLVEDNRVATEMAAEFHNNNPEYQEDTIWYDLIEKADNKLLYEQTHRSGSSSKSGSEMLPDGLLGTTEDGKSTSESSNNSGDSGTSVPPLRIEFPVLDGLYRHIDTSRSWEIKAFEVNSDDPDLLDDAPWSVVLKDLSTDTHHFLFDPTHVLFQSICVTPQDALLMELSHRVMKEESGSKKDICFSRVFKDFKSVYDNDSYLDYTALPATAMSVLRDIAEAFSASCPETERESLFNDLSIGEQTAVMSSLASKSIPPSSVISDGMFLTLSPFTILQSVISRRPDLCFDGKLWDHPYVDIDYGDPQISEAARARTLTYFLSLVGDAIWLSDASNLTNAPREQVIRAAMSVQLLRLDKDI